MRQLAKPSGNIADLARFSTDNRGPKRDESSRFRSYALPPVFPQESPGQMAAYFTGLQASTLRDNRPWPTLERSLSHWVQVRLLGGAPT